MTPLVKFGIKTLPAFLKATPPSSVFILVDENTRKHCLPLLKTYLTSYKVIQIKSGEKNKSLLTCEFIWTALLKDQADRKSLLINLGGGVITDMGAFCAATYMRGIDFINIPTSLLAMSDAAIGGKTGVDFMGYKNMIGSFTDPSLLCIDVQFLKTLPQRHLVSASSELFKHALLQNKKEVKIHLVKRFTDFSDKELEAIIKKSVKFKSDVVANDALEKDTRKQLNLGHTVGHALESYFLMFNKPLLHGEAIALGLVAETFIAHSFYNLSYDCFLNVIFWYDLNFKKPGLKEINFNTIIKLMQKDKKNSEAQMKMILLEKEGSVETNSAINNLQIIEALKFLVAF